MGRRYVRQRPVAGHHDPKRLDADPQLAIEMAVCAAYRVPHSEFLSWDSTDRDKAIWWQLRTAATCGGCGTRPEEWVDDQNAYAAELRRCRGCEVRERASASVRTEDGRGVHVVLVRQGDVRGQ